MLVFMFYWKRLGASSRYYRAGSRLNSSIWNSREMTNGKMRLTLASQMISVEPFFRLDLETQRNE